MRLSSRLCAALLGATLSVATLALAPPAGAASPDLVISQVYGGGGNSGATIRNDFVELFNRGGSAVDVAGFSVQYASASGSTYQVTPLSGTIPPGGYYLVQEAQGAGGTQDLPTPDATGTIAMSASSGKVALVTNATALTCGTACEPGPTIRDFVGYGSANEFEGSAAAPGLSNTTADARAAAGCTDTDDNGADFTAGAPAARNSASSANPCNAPTVPTLSVSDATTGEADDAVFTVTLSPASDATVTVEATTTDGTATAADDYTATTVTLTFALGDTTETVTVPVTDDDVEETDETFTLSLSEATGGAAIGDGTASATITDDDQPPPVAGEVRIRDIQGAQQRSPLLGEMVENVEGVVTAVRANGLYIQDDAPDTDDATSEGLFVFTASASTSSFAPGQRVFVDGVVSEFRPGGESGTGLSTTQITASTGGITISGTGTIAATIIGADGRTPPTEVIDDDTNGTVEDPAATTFDPATDGIDFYESLEGMLVTVNDPVVVDAASEAVSFGEYVVLADNGAGATGRTLRGGIEVDPDDFNPERIFLDDALFAAPIPPADVGDTLNDATGVVDYGFGNFKVLLLGPPTVTDGGLTPESTTAAGADELAIATFNVENLDPGDGAATFAALAAVICDNLAAPDLLSLEEVQDDNGPTNDAVVDADLTASLLIAAIAEDCAVTYDYADVDPVDDQDGGQPGGNIRVGFLYREDRGLAFVERPGATGTTANLVQEGPSGPQLAFSPGRIDPTNAAFANSRKPLAGEFTYDGETLFVIANHFNSKGGDEPLFGRNQPPDRESEVQRRQQATVVNDFVKSIMDADADANVVVLGDLNDFEFSEVLDIVAGDELVNLTAGVADADRYTFIFEGNSQVLDHILVSEALADGAALDIVHSNIEFAGGVSDHDPQVAFLTLGGPGGGDPDPKPEDPKPDKGGKDDNGKGGSGKDDKGDRGKDKDDKDGKDDRDGKVGKVGKVGKGDSGKDSRAKDGKSEAGKA